MLSIDLIREDKGLSVSQLLEKAQISKQSYYNATGARLNVTGAVLNKIAAALDVPSLHILHMIDRLYNAGIPIIDLTLPNSVPGSIRELIYKKHPIFSNGTSKYNRLSGKKQ